ncbi:hypothetical protein C2S53_007946 [Perilla frutescens var. hirtella]|uniref:Retrotransposon gag domain-containing protein n=1 Tax=Perilla frutescens var. hirtella TaxID=608512 RepID=A0AAD4J9X1_PERFH|nr:hypothetical protein C2S53_007946 [Perilla frutescens var. hirtella]
MSIPEFEGLHDPDIYLDWERKVENIFACYDFSEFKKVQLACLEFRGYAASWWEMQQERRRRNHNPLIDTWEEMKGLMRGHFIPVHYERELEKKPNRIKQGTRSIEEYHKELETALNRVGKQETLNATIIRYIEGMNPDIACEVELRDFNSIERMVQYASIAEKQLREGRRPSHYNAAPTRPSWNKGQSGPPERCFDSSTPQSSHRPESTLSIQSRPTPTWPNQGVTPPNAAPSRARDIQCHKCQGWGHFQAQCPNQRVIYLTESNEVESASEDEREPVGDTTTEKMPENDAEDEDIDPEVLQVSLVTIRSLSIIREEEQEHQRENIFYTRAVIKGHMCSMIIDSGSVINAISQYAVEKLSLPVEQHANTYRLQWLTNRCEIRVVH